MYLNEYYETLLQSVEGFDKKESNILLLQQAKPNDLITFEKYKSTLHKVAELGMEGSADDCTYARKRELLFEATKVITDTFGPKEYPENLKDESALVKALFLQVWVEHKERFAQTEIDSVSTAVAYALSYFPSYGIESVPQRRESTVRQANEMRKMLDAPAPKPLDSDSNPDLTQPVISMKM